MISRTATKKKRQNNEIIYEGSYYPLNNSDNSLTNHCTAPTSAPRPCNGSYIRARAVSQRSASSIRCRAGCCGIESLCHFPWRNLLIDFLRSSTNNHHACYAGSLGHANRAISVICMGLRYEILHEYLPCQARRLLQKSLHSRGWGGPKAVSSK